MFHFLHKKSVLLLAWVFCFTVLNSLPAIAGKCGSKQAECLEADFGEPNINRVNRIDLPRFGAPMEREQETRQALLAFKFPTVLISLVGEYLAIPAIKMVSNERGMAIAVGDSLFVENGEKGEKEETTDQGYASFSEVQLPPESTDEKASPVKIAGLTATRTSQFILTGMGKVFGWGSDSDGILGPSKPEGILISSHPVRISIPVEEKSEEKGEEENQEKVALLAAHMTASSVVLAVTESKKTFVWGSADSGLLCTSRCDVPSFSPTPLEIAHLAGKKIILLDATAKQALFVATSDAVYGWGGSIMRAAFLAGLHDLTFEENKGSAGGSPRPIPFEIKAPLGVKIQNLKVLDNANGDASEVTLLILGDDGSVYAWGCRVKGLLGDGQELDVLLSHININTSFLRVAIPLDESVIDLVVYVSDASPRAFALTHSGKVYHWGTSIQLVNKRRTYTHNTPMLIPVEEKVTHIVPGLEALFLAGLSGTLYQYDSEGMHEIWKSPLGGDSIESLTATKNRNPNHIQLEFDSFLHTLLVTKKASNLYLLIQLSDESLFIKKQVEGQTLMQGLRESEKVRPFLQILQKKKQQYRGNLPEE